MKQRLDKELARLGLVTTRSQAENLIRLGKVMVNGQVVTKAGTMINTLDAVKVVDEVRYVSRAGLKLASVAADFALDFKDRTVLDVGSSTGGFTDFALQNGAKKVIAVDVGTDQLHPSLRTNAAIELHEKTDIRDFYLEDKPDIIVMDVSFISLRQILPHIAAHLAGRQTQIVAMMKPQFEAQPKDVNKGVIKNKTIRRHIIQQFERWLAGSFIIQAKQDSAVAGARGNQERFYVLRVCQKKSWPIDN